MGGVGCSAAFARFFSGEKQRDLCQEHSAYIHTEINSVAEECLPSKHVQVSEALGSILHTTGSRLTLSS